MTPKKKLYFCGSIRGGRADAALYFRLIAALGQRFSVLTEHIGSPELSGLEANKSDADIWREDMAWLEACDLVVAECSTPSLGVGYELAAAKALGKPCFLLYRSAGEERPLSAMLAGDPYYTLLPYADEAELFSLLARLIEAQA